MISMRRRKINKSFYWELLNCGKMAVNWRQGKINGHEDRDSFVETPWRIRSGPYG